MRKLEFPWNFCRVYHVQINNLKLTSIGLLSLTIDLIWFLDSCHRACISPSATTTTNNFLHILLGGYRLHLPNVIVFVGVRWRRHIQCVLLMLFLNHSRQVFRRQRSWLVSLHRWLCSSHIATHLHLWFVSLLLGWILLKHDLSLHHIHWWYHLLHHLLLCHCLIHHHVVLDHCLCHNLRILWILLLLRWIASIGKLRRVHLLVMTTHLQYLLQFKIVFGPTFTIGRG